MHRDIHIESQIENWIGINSQIQIQIVDVNLNVNVYLILNLF